MQTGRRPYVQHSGLRNRTISMTGNNLFCREVDGVGKAAHRTIDHASSSSTRAPSAVLKS